MELTKSFPPADALFENLQQIDYKKHLNTYMNFVITVCAFIAAVATVIAQKWQEYDCTERLQILLLNFTEGCKTFYQWTRQTFIPFVTETAVNIQEVYNLFTARQFVTL